MLEHQIGGQAKVLELNKKCLACHIQLTVGGGCPCRYTAAHDRNYKFIIITVIICSAHAVALKTLDLKNDG